MVGGCPQAGMRLQRPGRDPCLPLTLPRSSPMPGLPPASQPASCRAASAWPEEERSPGQQLSREATTARKDPDPEHDPGREGGEMPTLAGGTYPKIHHHVGSRVLRMSAGSAGGWWAAPRCRLHWVPLLLGGLSPLGRSLSGSSAKECPARSPPSPARRGHSPRAAARFRAGCRRPTCCCWAGWRAGAGGWTPGQPRACSGAGAYSPRGKNAGEGGIKMKSSLASLRAKGRVRGS